MSYVDWFLWFSWFGMAMYIVSLGMNGWLMFKINMPFRKRAGTWFITVLRTGRIKINYGRFKTKHKWKDRSETQITKVFDRTSHSREPIICLVEGYAFNVPLTAFLGEFAQDSKETTTFIKTVYATGIERTGLDDEKKKDTLFWIQVFMPIGLLIIGLGILYVFFTIQEGNLVLTEILDAVKALAPKVIQVG